MVCDYQSDEFYYLLKALIRYYYNEWEYNTHWGGDDLYQLIRSDDKFFNKSNFADQDDFEKLLELIDCFEAYEDYFEGISLFAGYDSDGNQNFLLRALYDKIDPEISQIIDSLKTENYFSVEDRVNEKLKKYLNVAQCTVSQNSEFFRARIGYSKKEYDYLSGDMEGDYIYIPFKDKEIGSPPPFLAQSGRLNRAGVSFLYCATNVETAIAEVRPHPGDKVSIGCFKNQKPLKIFDIADNYLLRFYRSDERLDDFVFINTLNILFQRSIPPSKKESYSITQMVSDCIRKLGFDGILFNSSVGDGKNLVIFDSKSMLYTDNAANVYMVKHVRYDYNKVNS